MTALTLARAAAIPLLALTLHGAASAATAAAPSTAAATKAPAADELRQIATEAWLYAYPLVLMDVTRAVSTNVGAPAGPHAPMNQFAHVPVFPDANFTDIVRPNADTLYSVLWYDVSREPLLFKVPDAGDRYYLLEMLDMWTDVFSVPGTRTSGNGAQQFAIVGPNWKGKLPPGYTAYRSPTASGWVVGRTQTNGEADYPNVRRFQAGIQAMPFSGHRQPAAAVNPALDMSAPVAQVAKMDAATFFARFAQVSAANPPHANDYPMLARLARIGIVPGQPFDMARLTPAAQAALQAAPTLGQAQLIYAIRHAGTPANGWRNILSTIGTYGTDYTRRAAIAFAGLGANPVEDAVYPAAFADADGKPLDSAASYTIHFNPDQLPPTHAFWSVSLYNDKQFFAANPIHRYAIGDRDALRYNDDGSLDLLIQREAPPADQQSNWLPAPATGGFSLNLRVYWPKPEVLNGTWMPPAVHRISH